MERLFCFAMIILPTDTIRPWLKEIALAEQRSTSAINDAALYDLAKDASIYFIPPFEELKTFEDRLEQQHKTIFETELTIWAQKEALWPKDLSYNVFKQWFEYEIHFEVYAGIPLDTIKGNGNTLGLLFSPKQTCIDWVNENLDKIDRSYFGDCTDSLKNNLKNIDSLIVRPSPKTPVFSETKNVREYNQKKQQFSDVAQAFFYYLKDDAQQEEKPSAAKRERSSNEYKGPRRHKYP